MSNNTSTLYNENLPPSSKIIELLTLSIICLFTLLGNALVILAFLKGPRRMKTHTNYVVVNLAVSDLMVGCLSVPFWMCVELGITSVTAEKVFLCLDILFGTTSIFSLVAISLERMFAVKYPTRHFNMSRKPVLVSIALTWLIGALMASINVAIASYVNPAVAPKIATLIVFLCCFLLPLIIIVISYAVLFKAAWSLRKADNHHGLSREIHIAKTISVIISLFVFCWAPFFVINLIYFYCFHCLTQWEIIVGVGKILHYSNSMMNFFVYAVRSPDFRHTFKALVFNKCKTQIVRDRLRTISFHSAKHRTSTLLLKKPSANNNSQHYLNGEYSHNITRSSYITDGSESPTIGIMVYNFEDNSLSADSYG